MKYLLCGVSFRHVCCRNSHEYFRCRAKNSLGLLETVIMFSTLPSLHGKAKRDWKEIDSKKDDIRRLSRKCVGLKALLLQHAPGNQVGAV